MRTVAAILSLALVGCVSTPAAMAPFKDIEAPATEHTHADALYFALMTRMDLALVDSDAKIIASEWLREPGPNGRTVNSRVVVRSYAGKLRISIACYIEGADKAGGPLVLSCGGDRPTAAIELANRIAEQLGGEANVPVTVEIPRQFCTSRRESVMGDPIEACFPTVEECEGKRSAVDGAGPCVEK